jgi:hypothetical protein
MQPGAGDRNGSQGNERAKRKHACLRTQDQKDRSGSGNNLPRIGTPFGIKDQYIPYHALYHAYSQRAQRLAASEIITIILGQCLTSDHHQMGVDLAVPDEGSRSVPSWFLPRHSEDGEPRL